MYVHKKIERTFKTSDGLKTFGGHLVDFYEDEEAARAEVKAFEDKLGACYDVQTSNIGGWGGISYHDIDGSYVTVEYQYGNEYKKGPCVLMNAYLDKEGGIKSVYAISYLEEPPIQEEFEKFLEGLQQPFCRITGYLKGEIACDCDDDPDVYIIVPIEKKNSVLECVHSIGYTVARDPREED